QAEAIIETRVDAFMQWLRAREAVPAIRALHDRAELIRRSELDRARRALASGDDPSQVLEALAHGLTGKFLHGPTTLLSGSPEQRARMLPLLDHLLPERAGGAGLASREEDMPAGLRS